MNDLQARFVRDGYVIYKSDVILEKVVKLQSLFETKFQSRFDTDTVMNRNLIKRFAESIDLAELYASSEIYQMVKSLGVKTPVYCGPAFSHYRAPL